MSIKNKFWISLVLIQLMLGFSLALAEDVTFKMNIPNENNIKAGDTFEVQVLLDIDAAKAIKSAELVLTPTSGASFNDKSAVSGNLFPGATIVYNQLVASGYKYGETNTATEVFGSEKLFVTLKAKANTEGSVTFTFSGLVAKKGNFARTTTSISKTITIKAAAVDCSVSANCADSSCAGSDSCKDFYCDGCNDECALVNQKWACVDCTSDAYCGLGFKCENYKCVSKNLPPEANCNNGLDDDEDNFKDCADTDCKNNPSCVTSVCSDGILQSGESCDDNNLVEKDGCSKTCQIESSWSCEGMPSKCQQACTDTDADKGVTLVLDLKGTATGFLEGITYGSYTDDCKDAQKVIEYSCGSSAKGIVVQKAEYPCPNNGNCKDGACVSVAFNVEAADQETYNLLTAIRDGLDTLSNDANTLQKISAIASALKTYFG